MKYLISILCLLVAVSIITLILIRPPESVPEKEVVLTINDSKVTNKMIEETRAKRSPHHDKNGAFIDSIIVEKVLIQEAQRQKIDQEPEFRDAIKTFYEQSLIKLLLDRKNEEIDDAVTEDEIDSFISYSGKTITFSTTEGLGNYQKSQLDWEQSETRTERFDDLSSTFQPLLVGLNPGEVRTVFDTGNEWFAVRVDEVTEDSGITVPGVSRETVRTILASYKREQNLKRWINSLLSNAEILIKETEK